MKKIIYSYILLIITIVLIGSCKKIPAPSNNTDSSNNNSNIMGIIEKYLVFSKIKPDGIFMFESNVANNDPNLKNIVLAGGLFYDKQGNAQTGGGDVSIGNHQFTSNDKGTYGFDKILPQDGLYGTNVTFTLTPPTANKTDLSGNQTNGNNSTLSATVYSPLPINITNIPPRTPVTLAYNTPTTLTWNADLKDSNGVVIIAEYLPARYVNKTTLSQGFSTILDASLLVPDNGNTSVPWSFFSGFPPGGHIILWVARGNYTIASNGTYNYQVGGYTAAAVWDVVISVTPPTIKATNTTGISGFTAKFTNTATNAITSFSVPSNGGSLGTLTAGTYNIAISKTSNTVQYNFQNCSGSLITGTSAAFTNVVISSTCNNIIMSPKNGPTP